MKNKIYAVYKGDKFICEGTVSECAKKLKVNKNTVRFWKSPTNHKRDKGNRKIAIVVEEE